MNSYVIYLIDREDNTSIHKARAMCKNRIDVKRIAALLAVELSDSIFKFRVFAILEHLAATNMRGVKE